MSVKLYFKGWFDSLHGVEDNWVPAHSEVIVRAPDIDFILGIGSVGHRELGGQSIDVVEVSIRSTRQLCRPYDPKSSLVLVLLLQFDLVKRLVIERSGSHVARCRWLGSSHLRIGLSLSNSSSLPSSLSVRAFTRRCASRIERDILLLNSQLDPIYFRSGRTYLVDRLDFLGSSNASVGPSVRDLGELGTHHRALHSGRSDLRRELICSMTMVVKG
jgi:hypothetical protein